jgi:Beta-glucosidase/6-phospho-beta-glucosidase/beta-galactosidase
MSIIFPKSFRFGWSQAGFQSEMGTPGSEDPNSDWYVWVHDPENIASGLVSGDLPEHGPGYWGLYRMFHDNATKMGLDIARIGVEWSRIFPKPMPEPPQSNVEVKGDSVLMVHVDERDLKALDSAANQDAVKHYREIFSDLKARGIYFILNFYHWPLPLWVHDPIRVRRGDLSGPTGWLDVKTVVNFARFAAYVAWKFDDLVDEYSTMNEPNVVHSNGFMWVKSGFPPSYLNLELSRRAMVNLIQAHARAYDAVKEVTKKPIGIIYANSSFTPLTDKDSRAVDLAERDSRWVFFDAIVRGELMGAVRDDLKGRLDWIGVNYYTRAVLRRRQDAGKVTVSVVGGFGYSCEPGGLSGDKRPCSDFGWEIYPEGMYNVLMRLHERYRMPMYVTENGIADEHDRWRSWFLVSHLYQVHRAMQAGADVRGYFHWNLTDNLEWAAGYRMRFGLVYVDYSTKRRYLRPSALVIREIARQKAIPDYLEHYTNPPKLG